MLRIRYIWYHEIGDRQCFHFQRLILMNFDYKLFRLITDHIKKKLRWLEPLLFGRPWRMSNIVLFISDVTSILINECTRPWRQQASIFNSFIGDKRNDQIAVDDCIMTLRSFRFHGMANYYYGPDNSHGYSLACVRVRPPAIDDIHVREWTR